TASPQPGKRRPSRLVQSRGRFRTLPLAGTPSSSSASSPARRGHGWTLDRWIDEPVVAEDCRAASTGNTDRIRIDTVERVAGDDRTRSRFDEQRARCSFGSGISRKCVVCDARRRPGTDDDSSPWVVVKIEANERTAVSADVLDCGIARAADLDVADRDTGVANHNAGTKRSGGVAFNAKPGKVDVAHFERNNGSISFRGAAWQAQRRATRHTTR